MSFFPYSASSFIFMLVGPWLVAALFLVLSESLKGMAALTPKPTPLPRCTVVRNEPGALVRSEPGTLVRSEPGALVRSEPGALVRSEPGTLNDLSLGVQGELRPGDFWGG